MVVYQVQFLAILFLLDFGTPYFSLLGLEGVLEILLPSLNSFLQIGVPANEHLH